MWCLFHQMWHSKWNYDLKFIKCVVLIDLQRKPYPILAIYSKFLY